MAAPTLQARAHSGPSYTTLLDSTFLRLRELGLKERGVEALMSAVGQAVDRSADRIGALELADAGDSEAVAKRRTFIETAVGDGLVGPSMRPIAK